MLFPVVGSKFLLVLCVWDLVLCFVLGWFDCYFCICLVQVLLVVGDLGWFECGLRGEVGLGVIACVISLAIAF